MLSYIGGFFIPPYPTFYALKHKKVIFFKFSSLFPWSFQFFSLPLPTLTNMIVYLFCWATVFAYGFIAAGFFYA